MFWSENMWKKVNDTPSEDCEYLVCWLQENMTYSCPHRAYYVEEEDKFFSAENHNSHPLIVDIYLEIPEIQNM